MNDTQAIFKSRTEEFKILNEKRVPSAGHMQGLTPKEYNRINALHAYFQSKKLELA